MQVQSWAIRSPKEEHDNQPVFLPGNLHGKKGLVSYSPGGHKESDTFVTKHAMSASSGINNFLFLSPFLNKNIIHIKQQYLSHYTKGSWGVYSTCVSKNN